MNMTPVMLDWMIEGFSAGFLLPRIRAEWQGPLLPKQQPAERTPTQMIRRRTLLDMAELAIIKDAKNAKKYFDKAPGPRSRFFIGPKLSGESRTVKDRAWRGMNHAAQLMYHRNYMRNWRRQQREQKKEAA